MKKDDILNNITDDLYIIPCSLPGDTELKAEDKVELAAPEPGHGVLVQGHAQALPTHAEHESATFGFCNSE
jgi:hypothetical protein